MGALGFEVMLGALTTTGSLLAFAKLQGLVRGTPMTYKGQNVFNMALLLTTIGIFLYLVVFPGSLPFVLFDGWFGACIWSPARHAHRIGRHAGRDVLTELLRRPGLSGYRLCLE